MFRACRTQPSRIIASSSSRSSLHSSAVLHGQSSRQHVARAIRKANIAKTAERSQEATENKRSVVLGTRLVDDEKMWKKCLLARVLVDLTPLVSKEPRNEDFLPTRTVVGTVNLPKQTNFGVGETEKQLLFKQLPEFASTGGKSPHVVPSSGGHVSADGVTKANADWDVKNAKELRKANEFAKVVDLRNANAAGIAYENRKRIIEAFSTPENPFDPGRSEVQAALLTYKIRKLWTHLTTFKRDRGNLRGLRMLVHQRAKVLKYLKKVNQARYETVLGQLALVPESVEGELVV